MKPWKQALIYVVLLLIIVIETPIITTGYYATPEPSDAIIVLGAKLIGAEPSTMLRLRLEEALKLYRQNYASTIIVSGARGPDEDISEAEAMRYYLIQNGIPADRIVIEDQSFNTYQNLANSKKLMRELGLEKAIIVSNASHIRRALILARNVGLEASAAAAPMAGNNTYLLVKQYAREGAAVFLLLITTGHLSNGNSSLP